MTGLTGITKKTTMFYKLSNIASKEIMEQEMNAMFTFPNIYTPQFIIDGTKESIIPIITPEAKQNIQFSIWGLLPKYLQTDWEHYQKKQNTLNIKVSELQSDLYDNKTIKRCLIPITGYFGFYNTDGEIRSYYNVNDRETPFCVAGIYNQLEDGFYTCSLIVTKKNSELTSAGSINNLQPAILHKELHEAWLDSNTDLSSALALLKTEHNYTLKRYSTFNNLSINKKVCNLYANLGLDDAV